MVFIYIKINTELFWKGMSNVKKKKKKINYFGKEWPM